MIWLLPCSSRKAQFSAFWAYLVRNWKMWPTSMPRQISSLPLPSGEGSPATTLRMSKNAGSGKSRPKIDAGHVIAGFVGAADKVAHGRHAAVGEDAYRVVVDTDRADVTRACSQMFDDFLFGREAERIAASICWP